MFHADMFHVEHTNGLLVIEDKRFWFLKKMIDRILV